MATIEATNAFSKRFSEVLPPEHFRQLYGLTVSSIGLGSYLGEASADVDQGYSASVLRAYESGCNLFDTAANYRGGRSEAAFGQALSSKAINRDEIILATKGGYLPFDKGFPKSRAELESYLQTDFIEPGYCRPEEIVDSSHCMAPGYLANQLDRSLERLGQNSVDIYYLHNPETQLGFISEDDFLGRLKAAFGLLEAEAAKGRIGIYGMATWNGFRTEPGTRGGLSLEKAVNIAQEIAGDAHHFRVIQLPFNLAMTEALTSATQIVEGRECSLVEAADRLGVSVIASASLLQSRLSSGLPGVLNTAFPGLRSDAQRAIQFVRSAPGITSALVGMSKPSHVEENLGVASKAPASQEAFLALFSRN